MRLLATLLVLIEACTTKASDSSSSTCNAGNDFCQDDVTSLLQIPNQEQEPASMHTGPCLARIEDLPTAWRPVVGQKPTLAQLEAGTNRSNSAQRSIVGVGVAAARTAFDELFEIALSPGMREHGEEALDAVVSCASTGTEVPDLQEQAFGRARDMLVELGLQVLQSKEHEPTCEELKEGGVPTLIRHGNYLRSRLPHNVTLERTLHLLADFANKAFLDCEDLVAFLGFEPSRRLATFPKTAAKVAKDAGGSLYAALTAAVDIAGMLADESINMPVGALQFLGDFWGYLSRYPFPKASELVDQPASLISISYFIVDAAINFASGSGLYTMEVSYAPWMYNFVRENFYAILQTGDVNLVGKVLKTLQAYKCNSANDVQAHDGLNFLVNRFSFANHSWVQQADGTETSATNRHVNNYEDFRRMQRAWAVCGAFGKRVFEEPETYGSVVRSAMAFANIKGED